MQGWDHSTKSQGYENTWNIKQKKSESNAGL